ncbi:MAG TPA: type I DNA topoisomerase [Marinilabiliales bacterium]|jgi:DNA topoisomerase-1|nr:MAG: DNA topoisomerase I [Bacteroidetes bacterium GWA2_40_14]OFX62398.1 MAG: DNA topoisomerase I [Bacteroidetes bacterium GWC2_40_13]OFX73213.1 MAG: DNA topoisomerase I [Bacteroidetes bacterium GWD2_40_43]OFX92068.1 MAG: DNA topoisomerase I [Bacteroidetes bacterium GWE2_40_63]OFY16692.1 MAG: DNA topoisomerase I [Bacteroidetes bacterium GWF2_40_13]OFZ30588.1 MAG: DNA topoisomerase I [Bacteroidetes bacterium RIFOXYC2_FULL_40_12]HAM98908.1 type I DNA topoisomerase [Marinilabiliales bacterium]
MVENLVIVESPAKAKTIEKFLGKGYLVTSSFGHIRDLSKKDFGIDIANNYTPNYEISPDKKKVVTELKKIAKEAQMVWLASDEDREGEAIAWHLSEVLQLDLKKTKRIVFHEITKEAILHAIETPRQIDYNLVNAQQARRVLDRLVGFELSPVLWKKVKPSLSAGRVQSVAVRLLVEREREIMNFVPQSAFRVLSQFNKADTNPVDLKAELNTRFVTANEAESFLNHCKQAAFTVSDISKKPTKRTPAPPFTTSTLQQEASRKFGFSVSQTMTLAQHLYEAGKITYMRTDSVNLSDAAIESAATEITSEFGEKYLKTRRYKTKSKGAQEAHEAIRPTYMNKSTIPGNANEKKLYELIWKRTLASQMSDAELEKTTITIDIENSKHKFLAQGEMIKFDGFLKVYIESTDDEEEDGGKSLLPIINAGQKLGYQSISATQKFTLNPPRYTEASLVRKLEELGIGRPSTYAPTISTIQNRGYVIKEDRAGKERGYLQFTLKDNKITKADKTEVFGTEKSKLFPTDIGMVVNDYLLEHFPNILDFNFTADVEKQFDDIAEGDMVWHKMIDEFYHPFHNRIEGALEIVGRKSGERNIGNDPKTGKPVIVKIGRYGPMAQIGDNEDDEKPQYAALRRDQHIETITLEEALELFKLPRDLGLFETKKVVAAIGRFGPYVRHDNKFYSLKKGIDDPYTVELDRAIELIQEKRVSDENKNIAVFQGTDGDIQILNGRFGPYIVYNKQNYRIPKGKEVKELTLDDCLEIIKNSPEKPPRKKGK